MSRNPFDIVGFDLDGTLVDTAADLAAAVNAALASAGRRMLTLEEVRPKIGGGAKAMLAKSLEATGGCTDEEFRAYYKVLLDHYGRHLAVHSRPFPGALAALDALTSLDVRLALVTNKFESFAHTLLDDLGLADRFACIIGGDTLGPGKAKPSPAPILAMIERCGGGRAAFVGDSAFDIDAARAANIPSIAVSFGFLTQPVDSLGADAVIDHFDELPSALDRLGQLRRSAP